MLKPEAVTALIDSREQKPFRLDPLQTKVCALQTADYSLQGMETECGLERKELGDLISCVTHERDRFERELARLQGLRHRLILVEADWDDIATGSYRSNATPASVMGSLLGWMAKYSIPILFCGDRPHAEAAARRWLYIVARREYDKARRFAGEVQH